MALYLSHKVHYDHHHDQHGGAAQIKGHVKHHHQKLWQQADQRDVGRAKHRQAGQHTVNIVGGLLAWSDTRHKRTGSLQVVRHFLRVEHQGGIEKAEKDDKAGKQQNIQGLTRANRHCQILQPVRAVATAKPLRHRCWEEQDGAGKNGRNHARHVDFEGQVRGLSLHHAPPLLALGVVHCNTALAALDEHHQINHDRCEHQNAQQDQNADLSLSRLLIFAGIVAGLPAAIGQSLEQARQGEISILILLGILVLAAVVIYLVVFIERGQRRITVNYAKRQQGRRMMQAQASHLPLKVNMAGVIPAIFASSILLFPASVAQWFGSGDSSDWLQDLAVAIGPGQPLNILLFTGFIVFFCFFYTALMFNPQEVADNLKRSGAFVPGIRPGQQTANYIDGVLTRLTVFGSAYIALVCLLPQFLVVMFNVPFYLGGTSMLIVVVVVMDFMAQVQSHLMSHQYEGVMKKANLGSVSPAGRVR